MKTVFTTGEAAKICKVSQQTIIRCFDNGQLKGFRVPGSRFRRIPQFYEVWRCAGLRLMENSFDNAHVNFTHRGTFGDPQDAGESHTDLIPEPWGFRTRPPCASSA